MEEIQDAPRGPEQELNPTLANAAANPAPSEGSDSGPMAQTAPETEPVFELPNLPTGDQDGAAEIEAEEDDNTAAMPSKAPYIAPDADYGPGHKAGFVSIIGRPNAGKSTLLNALMGEKLSAVTYKAQTTRHRIFGIYSTEDEQIVFSDTPGILESTYELHKSMMRFVHESLEDAEILLLLLDATKPNAEVDPIIEVVKRATSPVYLILNKMDMVTGKDADALELRAREWVTPKRVYRISALDGTGVASLLHDIREAMPYHPPYFDKEQLSDRTERFFASEIIREKIFLNYKQEIPYSCEVVIAEFKDQPEIIRIRAEILVERMTQKGIIIGKAGEALKKVGTEARIEMETFFGKKVFLETYVRVKPDWRNHKGVLRQLGYIE